MSWLTETAIAIPAWWLVPWLGYTAWQLVTVVPAIRLNWTETPSDWERFCFAFGTFVSVVTSGLLWPALLLLFLVAHARELWRSTE